MSVLLRIALLAACSSATFAQAPPLVRILSDELDRNFKILRDKGDPAPYYVSYEVFEQEASAVTATLGALKGTRSDRSRLLDVTVRVGSPKIDNYHHIRGERAQFSSLVALPLDDVPAAIQRFVWAETDRVYRLAAERLIKVKASREVSVADEDTSDDFSPGEPVTSFEPAARLNFPVDQSAARVRKLSADYGRFPGILTSHVTLSALRDTRYLVDTDGVRLQHGRGYANLQFGARTKAGDGSDIFVSDNVDGEDVTALPADAVVQRTLLGTAQLATALPRAPVVDPYVGPAILSGRAAAVLFHEIFGHRIEGHRQKDETEGQTFTKMIGSKVLPDFLSVVFDASRRKAGGISLNGYYAFDDEGVKSRPVTVVDKGTLKTFLMSRSPVRGFERSNGHGRRQAGYDVVSRQSNLFVEAAQSVPEAKLRELLIAEVKRQNKPYGLYFQQVTGGFTNTARQGMQAFQVIPVVVFRIFPDGRRDELVRGADIVGTPLASFAKILATADQPEVFNGYCGAESGSIPVSAVSPAILISEIEIQKKSKSNDRPPLLPAPLAAGGAQ